VVSIRTSSKGTTGAREESETQPANTKTRTNNPIPFESLHNKSKHAIINYSKTDHRQSRAPAKQLIFSEYGLSMWKEKQKFVDYVRERRRRYKRQLLELKGGKCEKCGYSNCEAALEFHHIDEKEDRISRLYNRGWKRLVGEIDKTILLCANCHREQHAKEQDIGKKAVYPIETQ